MSKLKKKTNGRYRSHRNLMLCLHMTWNESYMTKLAKNTYFPKWAKKLEAVKTIINVNVCTKHGHDWTDNSHGGPESGHMSGECNRCGHSFHTQLY